MPETQRRLLTVDARALPRADAAPLLGALATGTEFATGAWLRAVADENAREVLERIEEDAAGGRLRGGGGGVAVDPGLGECRDAVGGRRGRGAPGPGSGRLAP
ncbi:hypothetical protein [Kitasatospora sp. NPDC087271]|uniref:hypothetical protein n=1 Tax=Kitasatospora sp. NPDC087271 TaxID=3364067 RepID=UPI00380C12E5